MSDLSSAIVKAATADAVTITKEYYVRLRERDAILDYLTGAGLARWPEAAQALREYAEDCQTEGAETVAAQYATVPLDAAVLNSRVLTVAELADLRADALKLYHLECHGVDNWEGYSEAMREFLGEDDD